MLSPFIAVLLVTGAAARRGGYIAQTVPDNDWAVRHLAEEHHVDNYNAGAFFLLHDFDSSGGWTPEEVRRLYGLEDESNKNLAETKKQEVVGKVMAMYDENKNGIVEKEEFLRRDAQGIRLPDFGLGPGHHGDDEYEYEIHHFEKFHDENTKEEDLTHPEDIAHFAKHEKEDAENERIEKMQSKQVVFENIPLRFRRKRGV